MILAIESTFDEIGAALARSNTIGGVEIVASCIASSAAITAKYGGAVPEVLAREQVAMIIPVIEECMTKANVSKDNIEAIAISYGPGLVGSLLIGVETAKTLAYAWEKPLLKVNHMVAHVLANFIHKDKIPCFPAVGLVISGGHTDLVHLKELNSWSLLGSTRDDAVGEAFDKTARILGLPYPGGVLIQKATQNWRTRKSVGLGIKLPRPMLGSENLDMSFSGLKTAVVDLVSKVEIANEEVIEEIANEFTKAIVEVLVNKVKKAIEITGSSDFVLAGGVAANIHIREALVEAMTAEGVRCWIPDFVYCTDNAPMIGAAAVLRPEPANFDLRPESSLEVI